MDEKTVIYVAKKTFKQMEENVPLRVQIRLAQSIEKAVTSKKIEHKRRYSFAEIISAAAPIFAVSCFTFLAAPFFLSNENPNSPAQDSPEQIAASYIEQSDRYVQTVFSNNLID